MPVFSSEQDVYDHIGRLLEEMVADPELGPRLQRADTVVQYRYADPVAVITVDLRRDSEPSCVFGESAVEAELIMTMDADTAHRFFLGEVNVTIALARGEIKARGPVGKLLKLVTLVEPYVPRYRAQLEAQGQLEPVPA